MPQSSVKSVQTPLRSQDLFTCQASWQGSRMDSQTSLRSQDSFTCRASRQGSCRKRKWQFLKHLRLNLVPLAPAAVERCLATTLASPATFLRRPSRAARPARRACRYPHLLDPIRLARMVKKVGKLATKTS
jgi:hypothetical protein